MRGRKDYQVFANSNPNIFAFAIITPVDRSDILYEMTKSAEMMNNMYLCGDPEVKDLKIRITCDNYFVQGLPSFSRRIFFN